MSVTCDECRQYAVAAVAQKGPRVGFRMVLATARSKEEAIGLGLAAFKAAAPDWTFCAPDALEIPDIEPTEPTPPPPGAAPKQGET